LKSRLLILTFLGGALGSSLRYLIGELTGSQAIALWIVNLLGALLLGIVHTSKFTSTSQLQAVLGTGFAGGFTTVSGLITFALLAADGAFGLAAIQVALGIMVYWLGRIVGGERPWLKS
jgi:CrcB protein